MNFRLIRNTGIAFMALFFINCGSSKTNNEVKKVKAEEKPKKEEYIVKKDVVKDIDGNSYNSVEINGLEWMTSNLRTTHFNDGTPIQCTPKDKDWQIFDLTTFYSYANKDSSLVEKQGFYYNYCSINTGKLAPKGWHVATKEDWVKGIMQYTRDKVNEDYPERELRSQTGWEYASMNGNDKYKLNILPAGFRDEKGRIQEFGTAAGFWTSTGDGGYRRACVFNTGGGMGIRVLDQRYGLPVRCVKDREESKEEE